MNIELVQWSEEKKYLKYKLKEENLKKMKTQ